LKCSVIIRCCNEESHIARLLHGILMQTEKSVEIIVVDSGSTDSTVEIISRYPVKLLTIKPEDFSFGHSLNIGCRMACGEYIIVASAHVYPVYRNWIEQLIAPFEDPEIALTYGKQRGDVPAHFSEKQIFEKWYPDSSCLNQSHPFCNNANAAIRRSVWEKIPYNETLTGLEDLDFAKRAMQAGFKIAYKTAAEVVHVHNESLTRIHLRYLREAIAHKEIFPHQHFNLLDFIHLFFANTISDFLKAFKQQHLQENLLKIIGFRLMQFWGTYQGFKQNGPISAALKQCFFYPNRKTIYNNPEKIQASELKVDYSKNLGN
jgi:glycosyltransferase involved in cell wall biosynthesis